MRQEGKKTSYIVYPLLSKSDNLNTKVLSINKIIHKTVSDVSSTPAEWAKTSVQSECADKKGVNEYVWRLESHIYTLSMEGPHQ